MSTPALRLGSAAYDVTTAEGLAAVGAVRERFLADPSTDLAGIRPRIADSWRRCAAMHVDPEAPIQIDELARLDEQTLQCAAPFVRELEAIAAEAGGDVTVVSPRGVMVLELTPAVADRYPQGLVLLEDVCGTNGDGTALEEGKGGWVHSREHYRSDMQETCCFTALIRDPFRDSVRACLTMTLPEAALLGSDPGSVGLLVQVTAAKIARELASRSAPREQMLFAEYLKVTRRQHKGAIIATDGKNTMISDPALELLREDDFAAISSYAQEALRSRRALAQDVTLSADRVVHLQVEMAGDSADPLGAIVLVKTIGSAAAGPPAPSAAVHGETISREFHDLVGESQAFRRALAMATTAVERRQPAHLIGENGTGKRALAARIAAAWSADVETLDCAGVPEDGAGLVRAADARLRAGGTIVLRDADALPQRASAALAELFRQLERPRVLLTLRRPRTAAVALTSALSSVEIAVPPLRARREDIPALTTRFIADLTDKKLSPRLLYVLAQADWPGNVAQLKSSAEHAAMVARGIEVGVEDLPQGFRGGVGQGSLSRLEEVELHELRAALEEADGNRTRAADILEIGRSTLYRRLDSYRRRGIVI